MCTEAVKQVERRSDSFERAADQVQPRSGNIGTARSDRRVCLDILGLQI